MAFGMFKMFDLLFYFFAISIILDSECSEEYYVYIVVQQCATITSSQ